MQPNYVRTLRAALDDDNFEKLMRLENPRLHRFVASSIELCTPKSVFVCTDSAKDVAYIRKQAVARREEKRLKVKGHTCHFDGPHDQGRDKDSTKYLLPPGIDLGKRLNSIPKRRGLAEITGYLRGQMADRQMLVRFFCLGPVGSDFSISGVQLTDSFYVAHSEDLLYRPGYEQFKRLGRSPDFFRVLHSMGEVKDGVSAHPEKRRIYIDIEDEIVYSVNTQYGGNTIGFKKLAFRLAIRRADRAGWLAEHMFVMGVRGPRRRLTYFTGAFPSFCGKTSTAMIPGETIVGDDLAYLRHRDGRIVAANVECGIFGIIRNVTANDDPVIWKVLTTPGEVIFSNLLVSGRVPYWLGDGRTPPARGINHNGTWRRGSKDEKGREIPLAHPNARFTIHMGNLSNLDGRADDPAGVPVGGIIYGGRDSDTSVPVQQSFDWTHGVITMGASLESESTPATVDEVGVRSFQPMSNLDFVAIPLGKYVRNHLEFGAGIEKPPAIFAVNYFQKRANGTYLTGMKDKYVWMKWMERRVHGDVDAIRTPTGCIPLYDDLEKLFRAVLRRRYSPAQYTEQFTVRIPENLAKIERIRETYRTQVPDAPRVLFDTLDEQRRRLVQARKRYGEYVKPQQFR